MQGGGHLAGALIDDAIRTEAPAAAARKAGIAAGHQVMTDAATSQLNGGVSQPTERFTATGEEYGPQQGGQAFQRGEIGLGGFTLHQHLRFGEATQLIEAPDAAPRGQGGRSTGPAEQAVHRRMHPAELTAPMLHSPIASHPTGQEIAQQQLLRKRHGGAAVRRGSALASPDR